MAPQAESESPSDTAAGDSRNQGPSRLRFIVMSNISDLKDPAARRLVRSQAARESQPKTRRPRQPKRGQPGSPRPPGGSSIFTEPRMPSPREDARQPLPFQTKNSKGKGKGKELSMLDPRTLLTARRSDPFSSFVRKLSAFEEYLIDYCKYQEREPELVTLACTR